MWVTKFDITLMLPDLTDVQWMCFALKFSTQHLGVDQRALMHVNLPFSNLKYK